MNDSGGRVNHGKFARQAWDEKAPNSDDAHKERGVVQRKFEKGLRDWNITGSPTGWTRPSRRSPEAHTERKSKNGDKKARLSMTPTKLFSQSSWKSSNKKQPLISEVAKHDRKGVEPNLDC